MKVFEMKFYMKHILLKKHKSYKEDNKVFLLNFSKSTKELLKNSNIFTRGCIIPTCITLIKQYFGENIIIHVPLMDDFWSIDVIEKINKINFVLNTTRQSDLYDKIHQLEMFYTNWGFYEKDYEKYGDLYSHFIPYVKEYVDVNDLIKDMNNEFDKFYKEE